ncbi:hypothetical protein [Micromonospora sp. DT229]|uniref:hypothetical protein n=1 Tax=Micromonospora sp. DT229 TaxID=3393430 RepID=UPI003CF6EF9D
MPRSDLLPGLLPAMQRATDPSSRTARHDECGVDQQAATVAEIASLTVADDARRRAQLTVQNPSAPQLPEVIPVRFTPEQWERAGRFVQQRQGRDSTRPASQVPDRSRRPAPPPAAGRAHAVATPLSAPTRKAASRATNASTTPAMRDGDGKRSVWLWSEGGQIHGSLLPVDDSGTSSPFLSFAAT